MRIPRLVLTLLLLGTPVAAVVATTTVASADPFTYTSVDVGNSAACAITNDGSAVCWGSNRDQYLIASSRELDITIPTKVPLPNNDRFVTIAGGACSWGPNSGVDVAGAGGHDSQSLGLPVYDEHVARGVKSEGDRVVQLCCQGRPACGHASSEGSGL